MKSLKTINYMIDKFMWIALGGLVYAVYTAFTTGFKFEKSFSVIVFIFWAILVIRVNGSLIETYWGRQVDNRIGTICKTVLLLSLVFTIVLQLVFFSGIIDVKQTWLVVITAGTLLITLGAGITWFVVRQISLNALGS